jgi:glycosyl transferase family 25
MSAPPALFAAFDRIRIVNLPSRTDRRAEMERELRQVGLKGDRRVAFFPAIACDDPGPFLRKGSHGAFLSHLALLTEAAEAGETILILQDDCSFLLPEIAAYQLPERWDIFYGGYVASDPNNLAESNIIGAHFMGFSARAAHTASDYLRRYLAPDFPPDARAASQPGFDPAIRPPIDGAFVWMRRAHPELVTTFAMLGVQRASRTDIGDTRWFDRVPGLRGLAGLARRLRSRLAGAPAQMANASFGAKTKQPSGLADE